MICLFDICIPTITVLWIALVSVIIVVLVIWRIQLFNNKMREQGSLFESHAPSIENTVVEEEVEEECEHPYTVGTRVSLGTYDDKHQVFVTVNRYDEDEADAYCELLIEVPLGATNVFVDHETDDDGEFSLGFVSVHYELDNTSVEYEMSLSNEALEESVYSVIIDVTKTIKV